MAMTLADMAPPRARPLTAAAVNLADGVNSKELLRLLRRHEAWQLDAAGYFSEIGQIHYIVNRAASALSEATLYAATMSEAGQLVPVDAPESSVTPAVAAIAMDVLAELRSPVGGQQQLVHQAYVNAEIAGEFFLVETETDDGPAWWVRSVLETQIGEANRPVKIKGLGEVPFDTVSRVWRPHPMRFEAADSGMRPVLGSCELVILIDRHFRAAMKSRLFAGLLLLPNSFRQGPADQSQQGDPRADPVVSDILDALNEGIGEEGMASAVTPNAIYGATDDIAQVRLLEFAQRIDPETAALRDASITSIVQSLEYPPEIVTGVDGISHWGAWWVGDSFIDHVRPKGDFLADAFTQVAQRPGMEARGVSFEDAQRVVLAFDYTKLARKPNIAETATLAHDRYVISDESLRRDLGYDDDDAPAPDEVAARVARKQTVRPSDTGVTTGPPSQGAVAASAPTDNLGGHLARLDQELVERLLGATVAAARRATELAGNRAKSRVASAHRDAVRTVPSGQVCAQLGPTLLAAAGLTEDELLAGSLTGLEKDHRRWARGAAKAALALTTAGAVLHDDVLASWEARLTASVDRSWEWFSHALGGSLSQTLATGGEAVESGLRTLVRQAVAVAGGATEIGAAGTIPVSAVTGIGTGPLTLDMLGETNQEVAGWVWVHDSPQHPFPEHEALDGAEAATIDEFAIDFDGWPGDHDGCLCVVEPLIRRADEA